MEIVVPGEGDLEEDGDRGDGRGGGAPAARWRMSSRPPSLRRPACSGCVAISSLTIDHSSFTLGSTNGEVDAVRSSGVEFHVLLVAVLLAGAATLGAGEAWGADREGGEAGLDFLLGTWRGSYTLPAEYDRLEIPFTAKFVRNDDEVLVGRCEENNPTFQGDGKLGSTFHSFRLESNGEVRFLKRVDPKWNSPGKITYSGRRTTEGELRGTWTLVQRGRTIRGPFRMKKVGAPAGAVREKEPTRREHERESAEDSGSSREEASKPSPEEEAGARATESPAVDEERLAAARRWLEEAAPHSHEVRPPYYAAALVAWTLQRIGSEERALAVLREISDPELRCASLGAAALGLVKSGAYAAAEPFIRELEESIRKVVGGDRLGWRNVVIKLWARAGRPEPYHEHATQSDPLIRLARILELQTRCGNLEAAEATAKRIRAHGRRDATEAALLTLGTALVRRGRLGRAEEFVSVLEGLRSRQLMNSAAWKLRVAVESTRAMAGDLQAAERLLPEGVQVAGLPYVTALAHHGRLDKAEEIANEVTRPESWLAVAKGALEAGDMDRLQRIVGANVLGTKERMRLAFDLAESGHLDEALKIGGWTVKTELRVAAARGAWERGDSKRARALLLAAIRGDYEQQSIIDVCDLLCLLEERDKLSSVLSVPEFDGEPAGLWATAWAWGRFGEPAELRERLKKWSSAPKSRLMVAAAWGMLAIPAWQFDPLAGKKGLRRTAGTPSRWIALGLR